MQDFWPSCGFRQLRRNAQGALQPTDDWWRVALALPQLALVDESCDAEIALHHALVQAPGQAVSAATLAALADDDARQNYRWFVQFRDAVVAAGSLEGYYLALMRGGRIEVPPQFIDWVVQAIVRQLLDDSNDAVEARAGEMLFRPQRISTQDGQLLAGDAATLDRLNENAGLGDIGRMLRQMGAAMPGRNLQVLGPDNSAAYWAADTRHDFLLDLSHEQTQDLGHGLSITLTRARSGLAALARVLQAWVQRLLDVQVRITPEQRIDDADWRWHIGLDVESSALLNDLYRGHTLEAERQARLISLFRLEFVNTAEMRPDVAGRPVYLGLAMNAQGLLRLKPQNLVLNLPLAEAA